MPRPNPSARAAEPGGFPAGADFSPLLSDRHVAVAVSGGSDSVALLSAVARLRGSRITALTVDHGLRPESADEARQVSKWSAAMGVAHVTLVWKGGKPRTGIQAAAREARYRLMTEWCLANGVTRLLTAHTQDDQAETVLMRLARTSSIESLAGIARHGEWDGVAVFRPLLGVAKSELRQFLAGLGQSWIDDPSNEDERFERVRVRKLMPALAAAGIDPGRLAQLAAECSKLSEAIASQARLWLKTHLREFPTGKCVFRADELAKVPSPVKVAIVRDILRVYGGGQPPERAEMERLAEWVNGEGTGRTLGGAVFRRTTEDIRISREAGRGVPASERPLTTYLH
ncbi:MAG: tRNA lysidine(34) synthetase TilS [Aestuariivirga sp.]